LSGPLLRRAGDLRERAHARYRGARPRVPPGRPPRHRRRAGLEDGDRLAHLRHHRGTELAAGRRWSLPASVSFRCQFNPSRPRETFGSFDVGRMGLTDAAEQGRALLCHSRGPLQSGVAPVPRHSRSWRRGRQPRTLEPDVPKRSSDAQAWPPRWWPSSWASTASSWFGGSRARRWFRRSRCEFACLSS
jgi:hypothetical protein